MGGQQPIKIGNAGGFWGDSPQAPERLLLQQPDLDFLTMDYLAEVSLSIMAIQREEGRAGYAQDFVSAIASLVPHWKKGARVKVVVNAGGLAPQACAQACQEVLAQAGLDKKIGIVEGDDVLSSLRQDPELDLYSNLDTKEPLQTVVGDLVTANAYLGAAPIAQALALGADIVITGRVADPSLTVGPCLYHYGWSVDDYQKIAGATIAGHLIECGTQATGGISTHWLDLPNKSNIGFPVVEVFEDGSSVLTKPSGTGGEVSIRTTKEQLLYEIGDPAKYLSPDATVSFLGLRLAQEGADRVRITGAIGSSPPPTYKVSATYRCGFRCDATLAITGPEAVRKAKECGQIVRERVRQAGFDLDKFRVECVGDDALAPGVLRLRHSSFECFLRLSAFDRRREALECFSREIAPLVTSGPQGVTGYIGGRPKIRRVFGYWPCLISKDLKVNVCLYKK